MGRSTAIDSLMRNDLLESESRSHFALRLIGDVALCTAIFVGGAAAIGGSFDLISDRVESGNVAETTANLEAAHNAAAQSNENLDRVRSDIGETCLSALEIYVNGRLSNMGMDTAISDIKQDPKQRCGDSITNIRVNYLDYSSAVQAKRENDQRINKTAPDKQIADTWLQTPNGALHGWLVFGIVIDSLVVGGIGANYLVQRKKYPTRRQQKELENG